MVLEARDLEEMGEVSLDRGGQQSGLNPGTFLLGGRSDEAEPAKELNRSSQEAGGSGPGSQVSIKCSRRGRCRTDPQVAAQDRDRGCFMEGEAPLTGMVGGEKGRNSTDNSREVRGAGPTGAFKESWEEEAREGRTGRGWEDGGLPG